jgi:FkbM family methyltransferase
VNPFWLVRNLQRALRVCPTWPGRLHLLRLAYSQRLPVWLKPEPNKPILFRYPQPLGNFKAVLRDNGGSDGFIFGEVFDHYYYDFAISFRPGTILDLGANVGYTVIFFARKYPQAQLACVEPMPQNLVVLRQNLSFNDIQATVFDAAVAVKDGQLQMETNAHDYGHKVAINHSGISGELVSCEGVSVQSLMKRLGWKRIGLLKVDIEGYERFLLKENCDWLRLVDAICIECHPGYSEDDLEKMASKYGFEQPKRLPGVWLVLRPA